jgi:ABC-type transporter Mla subunit MlaD
MLCREIPGRKKNTMKKIFSREVKIALTAIAAIVLLFFGLNFLKGMSLFDNNVEYKMMFTDLKGLMRNTSIYANGYKVGTVKDILYDFEKQGYLLFLINRFQGLIANTAIKAAAAANKIQTMITSTQP